MADQEKNLPKASETDQAPCESGCSGHGCGKASGGEPRCKLHSYNWLADIPGGYADSDMVEVTFKNTRKGYYKNSTHIPLEIGDMVAVEASPGHDIGMVTLTGLLVERRMKSMRAGGDRRRGRDAKETEEIKRVFRKAKPGDIERYEEARAKENDTMIRARQIAADLKLNMKIGDVEYQGDGNKAIFYYIADERVDFRQLIKVLAETFKVRIEMKQIGARQEAGRIGGIGPCGRPLCCSQWMTNFVSVATSAARFQDISLNPQKLAGQCAKLKCCLNFEVDAYVEGSKRVPGKEIRLETADATYFHFKTDIFKREITYSTDKNMAANLVTISADRAFEIIALNKSGEKPLSLRPEGDAKPREKAAFGDILGEDDLTRFDKKKRKKKKKPAQRPEDEAKPRQEGERPAGDKPRKKKRSPKPGSGDKPAAPKPPKE
ncbi:MAG: hypothetical protein HFJ87_04850 [Muribaculaceae bacterium]|nr:hypothetical protein [Muribaculaceae bacterium]